MDITPLAAAQPQAGVTFTPNDTPISPVSPPTTSTTSIAPTITGTAQVTPGPSLTPVSLNSSPQVDSSALTNPPKTSFDIASLLQQNQQSFQSYLDTANKYADMITGLMQPSSEMTSAQNQVNSLQTEEDKLALDTQDQIARLGVQPILTSIATAQQAEAGRQALYKQSAVGIRLANAQRTLQSAQASQQQKLTAAQFLYGTATDMYNAKRQNTLDTIQLYKETAPENIANTVDPYTGEMTVTMKNPITGELTQKNLGVVQTPQSQITNIKLAQDRGVRTQFWTSDGKTFINTQTGRAYSTPEQFFADGGSFNSNFIKANVTILPEDPQLTLAKEQFEYQKVHDQEVLNQTKYQAVTNPVTGESLIFNPKTGTFTAGPSTGNPVDQPYFGLGPKIFDAGQKIANQFDNEKVVQNFNIINEAKSFVDSLPPDSNSPADDQGLLYAFAKAMDPNSVVREGEYATVQKYAQSWLETFGFNAKRIVDNGEFLTAEARQNLKDTIGKKYDASLKNYQNVHNEYSRRIDQATGKSGVGNLFITDYSKAYSNSDLESLWNTHTGDSPPLDVNKAANSGGLTFNSPLSSNTSKAGGLATYASAKFPPGSTGGECGDFVREIANNFGLDYPRVGNSIAEKTRTVQKYGVPLNQAGIGSVIITSENKASGHVAWIIGKNDKGFIVAESNFAAKNKVSYGRVIPYSSKKIIGVINPSLKTHKV
jgi:hypothetical protein